MARKAKTIIHVNMFAIRRNKKTGGNEPVITVKRGKTNTYAHSVRILGPSELVYSPLKPLKCGARVWISTTAPVEISDTPLAGVSTCDNLQLSQVKPRTRGGRDASENARTV